MSTNGLYAKCCFSEKQLDAIKQIYKKHFEPKMPVGYRGTGVAAFWEPGAVYPKPQDLRFDPTCGVRGFVAEEARLDPLWDSFHTLLPYMRMSATITRITPGSVMNPHIDRTWRPEAIYFPIEDCTPECVSSYYEDGKEIGTYAVYENAYLTNVHKMHGVKNNSDKTRVAFGWNFKDPSFSFEDCQSILKGLGYIER